VAHSFGTYAIARILAEEADIRIHRLVLCGSIIPAEYRWDLAASRIATDTVNECGSRDIWPLLATACTWGYGPSGTFGFGAAYVTDRFHDFRHSDFFSEDFAQKFWLPLFLDGQIVDSSFNRPTPASWQNLLPRLPLRWAAVALLPAAVGSSVLPLLPQRKDRAAIISEQRDQARSALRGLRPGRVAIFVQDGDPEASSVAEQLRTAFLEAGWASGRPSGPSCLVAVRPSRTLSR
jgi:hypothetical protein